jgi:hypothetical protein
MNNKYTGGCQCGEIRYEIHGEPLTFYACHCRECQKQSASAFGLSLTVPREAVKIVQGQPKTWTRESDRWSCCHLFVLLELRYEIISRSII